MKIQLSISLLASNRAASLERCLDSLRPLLMQVPSELIVVFTGTDERVREIASRYTDKILPFTWCDNFSAARNVGLWAAKGEWFMYIDDDEWFEDVTEIRDFFLSGEYRNYGSAFYKQKNYTDWDGIHYSDYHAFRMTRIIPGTAFQNKIHEELTPRIDPGKYFDAYVNHYGYVSDSGRLSLEKSVRNIPLLLENIQERPSYIKNYLQITQEYYISMDLENAEKYCRKGRNLCKGASDSFYESWLQVNLVSILVERELYQKAEEEALMILDKEDPWELTRLSLYKFLIAIYTGRNDSEKVLKYGVQFEETLAYMDQNPELWFQQSYAELTEASVKVPTALYQMRMNCTEAALKLNDADRAVFFLKLLPWTEEVWIQRYYPNFDSWKEQYGDAFQTLLAEFPEQSPYRLLQKNRCTGISETERRGLFIQCITSTESPYLRYQAVKEAVLCQIGLSGIVDLLDLNTWKEYVSGIVRQTFPKESEKLQKTAKRLRQEAPIYGLWLDKLLYERELIRGCLIGDALIHLLDKYAQCVLLFYRTQYRDEMLDTEKRSLLPPDCRFAYVLSKALEKMEAMEYPAAIRLFREAIRYCPDMTGVIRETIRQMSVKADVPSANAGEEFRMLTQQMKDALKAMITNGQYADALPVILQLSPLLPEDLELLRMRQEILRQTAE